MDQGANPSTILHVLIPVPIRLKVLALFHQFGNRIVLCNVAPLYKDYFGEALNVQLYGCLNMNQFFNSMKHLFFFHQMGEVTYVNCYLPIDSIKLTKDSNKILINLESMQNIFFIFEPHEFNCIRSILLRTFESGKPIKISQFEQEFILLAGYCMNYLKYGFKSASDFFITFSDLFIMTRSNIAPENSLKNYSVKDSLGDMLVILKSP